MTFGMIDSFDQPTPKTSVSFLKFWVAASRIEKTVSPSHPMQRSLSCSSKNLTPSWLARRGIYSMMARRTRHCLSSANCTIAGSNDWERSSMPITISRRKILLDRLAASRCSAYNLTLIDRFQLWNYMQANVRVFILEHLEEHWEKMVDCPEFMVSSCIIDSRCTSFTYSCFPRRGARPLIWVPKAARTCWDGSETRSSTVVIISLSRVSRSIKLQNPGFNIVSS